LKSIGFTDRDALQVMIARLLPVLALIGLVKLRPKWRSLMPVVALLFYMTILHALTRGSASERATATVLVAGHCRCSGLLGRNL
jgi:hypothetical protein